MRIEITKDSLINLIYGENLHDNLRFDLDLNDDDVRQAFDEWVTQDDLLGLMSEELKDKYIQSGIGDHDITIIEETK